MNGSPLAEIQGRLDGIRSRMKAIDARFHPERQAFEAAVKKQEEAPASVQRPAANPIALGPNGAAPVADMVSAAAMRHGLDPALVQAVVSAESGGDAKATSPVGAMGLMQLMPGTAKDLGVADAYDPAQNLEGGSKYLAAMTKKFGLVGGVAAYNAGPGAVAQHGGAVPPYPETQAYVERVMRLYEANKR